MAVYRNERLCGCRLRTWRWLRGRRAGGALPQQQADTAPVQGPPAARFTAAPPRRAGGRPKPAWAREWIHNRHAEGITSLRRLKYEFDRIHACLGVTVSHNTVRKWIAAHSARPQQVRTVTRNRFPEPVPANLRWALDCTGKADACGKEHCILGIVDHGTRCCSIQIWLRSME